MAFAAIALKSHATTTTAAAATTTTTTTTPLRACNTTSDDGSNSGGDCMNGDEDNDYNDRDGDGGDDAIRLSVAAVSPVCSFLQQHLTLFSVDTLLSTRNIFGSPLPPNVTTIAIIENEVGLIRNVLPMGVDGKDLTGSTTHPVDLTGSTTPPADLTGTTTAHSSDGSLISSWPVEIQQLLEFRRIIDR